MKNKQAMLKRARRLVKGLIVQWTDDDPLADNKLIRDSQVSHRKPLLRLSAEKVFADYKDWIVNRQPFRWLITIDVIFRYDNGIEQTETRELEAVSTVSRMDEHCHAAIEDALRHGDKSKYRETRFTIECLGN